MVARGAFAFVWWLVGESVGVWKPVGARRPVGAGAWEPSARLAALSLVAAQLHTHLHSYILNYIHSYILSYIHSYILLDAIKKWFTSWRQ